MSKTYDIVIAGGGHNGLVAACYLAKAGRSVCVVEKNDKVGGGVMTRELTVPGFKHDVCSVAHTLLQANPLLRNDELELKSKFGLTYINPDKMTAIFYDDGSTLEFYTDLERTCRPSPSSPSVTPTPTAASTIRCSRTSTCWSWACSTRRRALRIRR